MTSDCEHTVDDIARLDPSGLTLDGEEIVCWAECDCGAATLVRAGIDDVQLDEGGGATYGGSDE